MGLGAGGLLGDTGMGGHILGREGGAWLWGGGEPGAEYLIFMLYCQVFATCIPCN